MGHSFAFWFWVVGDHPSALMSHQSVTSVKAVRGTHHSVTSVKAVRGTHQSVTSVKAVRGTHQSVTSVKAVVARGAVAACNGAATRSGRPRQPTHHAQWEAIAHDRASRRKQLAAQMGGEAESHTHRSSTDTLHVSARSMWPALSPRSYLAFSTAACGHAPRRAGLGGRPRSRTRCGHARWLRWLRA